MQTATESHAGGRGLARAASSGPLTSAVAAPRWPGLRSKVLTVSRLLGRAACARADHLRHEDELALVAGGGTEAMVRGSVIHAGLAAASAAFPAEPDPARVAAACSASAV